MDILYYKFGAGDTEYGNCVTVENRLDVFQDLVGGYIEVYSLSADCVVVFNEEASIFGLPPNALIHLPNGELLICGDFFICSRQGAEFAGITPAQKKNVKNIVERID